MISSICSFKIINIVCFTKSEGRTPDPNIFFWIAASAVEAAAVNSNGFKTLLANDLSLFFIKDKPVFGNDPKILPKNAPNYVLLWKCVFDKIIKELGDELFARARRSIKTIS